ncbi:hypothetical protein ACJJTC_002730 [Scirpophaga incertulas]
MVCEPSSVPQSHAGISDDYSVELDGEEELVNLLEIVICDAACANARICELALVLIYHKLEQQVLEWSRADGGKIPEDIYYLYEYGEYLQAHYVGCVAGGHSGPRESGHVAVRREQRSAVQATPGVEVVRAHSEGPEADRSSGSESEEMSDWPRSPVLLYCDN